MLDELLFEEFKGFPLKGKVNPVLSVFNGKKYIMPYIIEVPINTTLKDVRKWVIFVKPKGFVNKLKKEKKSIKRTSKKSKFIPIM